MKKEKYKCVFDSAIDCPVRKDMAESSDLKRKLDNVIKPLGDKQMLSVFMPIMKEMATGSEYRILHFYCAVCHKKPKQ